MERNHGAGKTKIGKRMKLYYRVICSALYLLLFGNGVAQVQTIRVAPGSTSPDIRAIHGNHVAYLSKSHEKNKLVLMIVGTGGLATDDYAFDSSVASMGYHVISLDYNNTVITTACSDSKEPACFNEFRQELVFGTPVSRQVEVDSANSIYNRFTKLLAFLAKTFPQQGWDRYISQDRVQWQNIIVAGHSQGAGHAAFLGKHFPVSRVLIFAGPQDYLNNFNMPAGWLSEKGLTAGSQVYAFLHLRDPFDFNKQLAGCMKILGASAADTARVQPGVPVRGNHHILVSDIITTNPHGSVVDRQFRNVWNYMLESGGKTALN
jgi:pimeloyl-ACP methyl ester carboxylesterase